MEEQSAQNQPPVSIQAPPPVEPPPVKKPFLLKTILAVFVIAIVLILLPAGTYLFLNSNRQVACTTEAKICPDGSSVGRTGPKCEFTVCPASNAANVDPTANWKTYSNSNGKYSIKYPSDFHVISASGASGINIVNTSNDFHLIIDYEITDVTDLNKYLDQKSWCVSINSKNGVSYKIDAENFLRYEKNPCGQAGSTDLYVIHNKIAYHLSIPTQDTYDNFLPMLNQILSTFKFTDSTSQTDTSNWKTYTSEKGKFSLQYPPSWVQPSNREFCNPDIFDRTIYLGPDENSVMICGSSFAGLMHVGSVDGNDNWSIMNHPNDSKNFIDYKNELVTVSGFNGKRLEGVYNVASDGPGLNKGTKVIEYIFNVYGRTYEAAYTASPNQKDLESKFDLIVKSLIFTQ